MHKLWLFTVNQTGSSNTGLPSNCSFNSDWRAATER